MKSILIQLLILLMVFNCSETKTEEPKKLRFTIDKELGEAIYLKQFVEAIKNQNCVSLLKNLDEKVEFQFGERKIRTFEHENAYLESNFLFSICNLFFDTKVMRERLLLLGGTNLSNLQYLSPLGVLEKSPEIKMIISETKEQEKDVKVIFSGAMNDRFESISRDVEFKFHCPIGFQNQCLLFYFSFK